MTEQEKREKVAKGLECCMLSYKDGCDACPYLAKGMCQELLGEDALALLKAQVETTIEPKRIDLEEETKAWLDKMDAVDALANIANICIDWDGYRTADGLGGLVNEIWAYARYCADRIAKAQEAVEPDIDGNVEYDGHGSWWHVCGACRQPIDKGDKFCRWCGRAVKWE